MSIPSNSDETFIHHCSWSHITRVVHERSQLKDAYMSSLLVYFHSRGDRLLLRAACMCRHCRVVVKDNRPSSSCSWPYSSYRNEVLLCQTLLHGPSIRHNKEAKTRRWKVIACIRVDGRGYEDLIRGFSSATTRSSSSVGLPVVNCGGCVASDSPSNPALYHCKVRV